MSQKSAIPQILKKYEEELLTAWVKEQLSALTRRTDLISEASLKSESAEFIRRFRESTQSGELKNTNTGAWVPVREFLAAVSRTRSEQGFSPSETATFVFSFKQPLFDRLRQELGNDPKALVDEMWIVSALLDELGLHTTEVYQAAREKIINRQQEEMLELSTPVVKLWDGVLALPMIGTLDSARTQVVMETLLQRIVETGSEIAIIDITGVPTVDTLVAQHLLKTVTAARLMGAECIISGIRPQIASTIVHLGVDLSDITTKASLSDAFLMALRKLRRSTNLADDAQRGRSQAR